MACRLCSKLLPLGLVEKLDEEIRKGDHTIVQLAERYNVDPKRVATHVKKCVKKPPKSGYDMLTNLLSILETTAREMHQEAAHNSEDNPYAMGHFIKLAKEVRDTVTALDKLQPSTILLKKITDGILTPLMLEFASICVEEVRRTRTDLLAAASPEDATRIDRATKELTARMAERYNRKTRDLIDKLSKILSDDFGGKTKQKPSRPATVN